MAVTGSVLRNVLLDQWSSLDYKKNFHDGRVFMAPTWIGSLHARRLQAYMLLQAYRDNIAREWLDTPDEEKKANRREYGDADLIVETVVAAILGNEPTIRVEDANVLTEGDKPERANPGAAKLQEWFDTWADDEHPLLAVLEGEDDAVTLGDAVYHVSWDATKGRPIVTEYDPGMYFPVLDEGHPRDYPAKVHIAWEFERWNPNTNTNDKFVRRMTWELVSLSDMQAINTGELSVETVTQDLPWNATSTGITCLWTDAVWPIDSLGDRKVQDLELSRATYETNAEGVEINGLDLAIDFIPVVHLPNTVARKTHFGTSTLQKILQILDELAAVDTDLALSARTTGFPPIAVKGALERASDGRTVTSYGPGTTFEGEVTVVDTSKSLDALLKYIEFLLKRLSVNSRIPESALGRVDITGNLAGITLALSFGPLRSLVTKMRMVREEKYPILWKFVARFAMQAGLIDANTDLPTIHLDFGSYLPQDAASVVTYVAAALTAGLCSRTTAVKILMQDAGFPIEDAEAEVKRIEEEDFTGAKALVEALGAELPAYEYLGIRPPSDVVNPPPPPPPPPTGGPFPQPPGN